jgi:phosphoribosylanthranilate isomerase
MTRIKICGITRRADVDLCTRLGVDMIGLNFHPKSSRYIAPQQAIPLVKDLCPWLVPVGVFVEHSLNQACVIAHQLGLRAVQWYGTAASTTDPFPFAFIPSFRVKDAASLEEIIKYLAACQAYGYTPGAVLIDSHVPGAMGGTGHIAPWEILADWPCPVPLILAGGLNPGNVAQAIKKVKPAAVDLASGVESSPGIKDPDLLKAFVEAVQGAG